MFLFGADFDIFCTDAVSSFSLSHTARGRCACFWTFIVLPSLFVVIVFTPSTDFYRTQLTSIVCSLLHPIGSHRRSHTLPSQGKRRARALKARQRKGSSCSDPETRQDVSMADSASHPQPPHLSRFLTVGFNSTVRYLENLSHRASPASQTPLAQRVTLHPKAAALAGREGALEPTDKASADGGKLSSSPPIAAVFVPRSSQPSVLHSHLPLLVYTASLSHPSRPQTRLVTLPKGSEARLCTSLGIPRANIVGLIEGAAETDTFLELIRARVPVVEVPWLSQAESGAFLPSKLAVLQSAMPEATKAHKRRRNSPCETEMEATVTKKPDVKSKC